MGLTAFHACNRFDLVLRFFDTGRRIVSKMGFQRSNMSIEFAFRNIIIQFLELLNATFLVKFKIIANCIFRNANQFRNLGMC